MFIKYKTKHALLFVLFWTKACIHVHSGISICSFYINFIYKKPKLYDLHKARKRQAKSHVGPFHDYSKIQTQLKIGSTSSQAIQISLGFRLSFIHSSFSFPFGGMLALAELTTFYNNFNYIDYLLIKNFEFKESLPH